MASDPPRQRKGMWEKLKNKKEVEREHESNFNAGRINIHERHLHRTGIRGRKRYIYYACLYLLGILCFINLVILCIMLSVLRIDKSGMESLSLFKSGLVRWMNGGKLKHVVLKTGEIGAFDNRNLSIVGQNADVKFSHVMPGDRGSFAAIGPNQTLLQAKDGVRIVSTDVDKTILHIFDRDIVWDVPAKAKNLDTTYVVSHRITSDHTDNLNIIGSSNITIRGNENLHVDSGELFLKASSGSINFEAGSGSEMTFKGSGFEFRNLTVSGEQSPVKRYKLCYCTNTGELFKIEAKQNAQCANARSVCLK